MFDKRLIKNIDFGLIGVVVVIFLIGVIIITSATNVIDLSKDMTFKDNLEEIMNNGIKRQPKIQVIAFIIGILAIVGILCIDYNSFGDAYKTLYIISIILLLLVYVPGLAVDPRLRGGARSWINLGIMDLQTSEIAKLGFILAYAKYVEKRYNKLDKIKDLIGPALFVAPFILLLLKQPDLGSALVFAIIAFGMLFMAGINIKIVFYGGLIGISSMPLVYRFLKPHQKKRIDAFLNPSDTSLNWHVDKSKTAIGSGMVYGKGLFKGTFHRGDFLPVQETDFIYAVLGEELGLIGCSIVLLLYFLFLYKMIKIAKNAKDIYGLLVVTGITFMFAFQIIENIGMTVGIMPVTGVTLPFLSYGGSSLITSMIALGLVLNVSMRNKKIRF
ncbi:rod shape-determining protein RodA [Paramaledivibacter caminithermalis]|jgi:rod shape determining protein RodA|uniref:Rod shape determining protein RodA n=1 Tax=Paramaledivibacter caminithermalis (strain DSM 15212 / CIP 107654 / DViRD3) TaxID=1121301 RepID=A0A1M6MFL2_PARC5|nr:rod shape-determining protein RodA [Paramaledivibacter caminithermalis]SHJ82251.1 rod shape determining protein RodA [Paramaledivibacter caminithermalis DSM 15212]